MKKKFLALLLTLVMTLALAVPALADSVNGCTDPSAENVEFSVAPIGVATIRGEYSYEDPDYPEASFHQVKEFTAYVFDRDVTVTRKDGVPLTHFVLDDGIEGYHVNIGNENFPYARIETAGISAEQSWLFKFGTDSDDEADWTPWMISKKGLELMKEYEDYEDEYSSSSVTVLEYRPLSSQPEKPAEPEQPAAAGAHTVKAGDTWGQLALNHYGTYGVWKQLRDANKGVSLKVGASVKLPEKLGRYTLLPEQVLAEGEKLYTVKAGDTLGQIAADTYKDINLYKAIFERNRDRLTSADMIYEGQLLVLPAKPAK